MHDLFKLYRIRKRVEFCGYEMVNMLQSVSNGRPITKDQYIRTVYSAFLSYFGGGTLQYSNDGYADRRNYYCFPHPVLFFIKGLGGGKAKILWIIHPMWYKPPNNYDKPTIRYEVSDITHKTCFSLVQTNLNTSVDVASIWPTLHIADGEVKMILEVELFVSVSVVYHANFVKKLCFLTFQLKPICPYSYFNTIIVFTPKPGLFSENAPS
ncbi:MAG: hypothetical protein LBB21_01870 [Holosporaceae bacterium]|jgi:hypothetical protein|nr:hypothetical protein [Holosporaceae bacterium]